MTPSDYKHRQIEHADQTRPRYNLAPIRRTPIEHFYADREHAIGLELVRKLLPIERIQTLMVCGVGAGDDLHYWLAHIPLKEVFGLDFSIEAIKSSQRRVRLNNLPEIVRYFRADFENIPVCDNAVDFGVYVHALHHALNPERAFKELWRVSRMGMMLIEPLSTPVTRLFAKLGLAQDVEEAGNKVIRFKPQQVVRWAGDERCKYLSRTYLYYYHPLIYRRLLPLFNSDLGFKAFRALYALGNVLLFPLRSKMAFVRVKIDNRSGDAAGA